MKTTVSDRPRCPDCGQTITPERQRDIAARAAKRSDFRPGLKPTQPATGPEHRQQRQARNHLTGRWMGRSRPTRAMTDDQERPA
jgi:hypothetical protein